MNQEKKQLSSDVLQTTLNYFIEVVREEIDYIVFFGTLLGIIRDKKLINNDDDIDLLVPIKYKEKLLEILSETKIVIEMGSDVNNGKYFLQGIYSDRSCKSLIDFYFYEENDKKSKIILKSIHGPTQNIKRHWLFINKNILFPKKQFIFNKNTVNLPNNSEKVLQFLYGKKWKEKIQRKDYRLIFFRHRTYVVRSVFIKGLFDEYDNFKRHRRIKKSIKTLYYLIPEKTRRFLKKLF